MTMLSLYLISESEDLSEGNIRLREFLRARNPKNQHSATLESFLIKPIQRILKYPLLLQQLKQLTQPQSDEHVHLAGMVSLKHLYLYPA